MSAWFLVEDADGRVGLFTWDPHHTPAVQVPSDAHLQGLDGREARSARDLLRDAATLSAAANALAAGNLAPPGGARPERIAVVEPPEELLARPGTRSSWSLERVVSFLHDGSPTESWQDAADATAWIDVFAAWDDPEAPSGLARFQAAQPYGTVPPGADPEATFLRVGTLQGPAFRTDDLPVALAGSILRLPLRFAELGHVDFTAHGACHRLGGSREVPAASGGGRLLWVGLAIGILAVLGWLAVGAP